MHALPSKTSASRPDRIQPFYTPSSTIAMLIHVGTSGRELLVRAEASLTQRRIEDSRRLAGLFMPA